MRVSYAPYGVRKRVWLSREGRSEKTDSNHVGVLKTNRKNFRHIIYALGRNKLVPIESIAGGA